MRISSIFHFFFSFSLPLHQFFSFQFPRHSPLPPSLKRKKKMETISPAETETAAVTVATASSLPYEQGKHYILVTSKLPMAADDGEEPSSKFIKTEKWVECACGIATPSCYTDDIANLMTTPYNPKEKGGDHSCAARPNPFKDHQRPYKVQCRAAKCTEWATVPATEPDTEVGIPDEERNKPWCSCCNQVLCDRHFKTAVCEGCTFLGFKVRGFAPYQPLISHQLYFFFTLKHCALGLTCKNGDREFNIHPADYPGALWRVLLDPIDEDKVSGHTLVTNTAELEFHCPTCASRDAPGHEYEPPLGREMAYVCMCERAENPAEENKGEPRSTVAHYKIMFDPADRRCTACKVFLCSNCAKTDNRGRCERCVDLLAASCFSCDRFVPGVIRRDDDPKAGDEPVKYICPECTKEINGTNEGQLVTEEEENPPVKEDGEEKKTAADAVDAVADAQE